MLRVENIKASYGKELIVDDVSFTIEEGELTALLGLNGAGKTTLLKVISGLLKQISGRCLLEDRDIHQMNDKLRARHISFMPQRYSIVYDTKVIDVVLMGITPYLGPFDTPTKEQREEALASLVIVGMEDYAAENFRHLSEGQKQLVLVARNLLQDAEIMFFDEPDSALDFNNSHMILSMIRDVIKAEDKAGLITLHDPNMALNYCDKIIILKNGKKYADFYLADVGYEFLKDVFIQIYDDIKVLEHDERYIIIR
ncbi:MAG: ABC transporter ATP-binding protein [Clostridiaceae bacterium]|nr:ABC transporter ATP-binding protein [Clostridiaceae bacterium]NLW54505.1 ABC transporter ATP-binding protein [Clostridiaceae bacterium]